MYAQPTRITIPVSTEELEALRKLADRDMRHPRDQARYILRRGLGLLGERQRDSKQNEDKELVKA